MIEVSVCCDGAAPFKNECRALGPTVKEENAVVGDAVPGPAMERGNCVLLAGSDATFRPDNL